MSLPFEIEKNLEAIRSEVERDGAELVDITFRRLGGRHVLTVTADKAGGITLDDCAQINLRLGIFLDEKTQAGLGDPLLQGPYNLEVVSPGLDRPLKTTKDFGRAIGESVLVTFKKEDDSVATWKAKLTSVDAAGIELQLRDGAKKIVPLEKILHAHRELNMNSRK